jgi:iron complex transport system permease protein
VQATDPSRIAYPPDRLHLRRSFGMALGLIALLMALFTLSILVGGGSLSLTDAFAALLGSSSPENNTIVQSIRLPRALASLLCGAALGVSGAILQTLFRNPLADPYVLGISSGSSLALGVSILLGVTLGWWGPYNPYSLYLSAFVGALAVMVLMISISGLVRSITTILVVGVMVGYVAYAATSILQTLVEIERLRIFVYWTLGSFSGARWSLLAPSLPLLAACLALSAVIAKPLDALLLGEDYARSMGMRLGAARLGLVALASMGVALVTTVAGPVGFVGLCAPYLARQLSKTSSHRLVIPYAMLMGSILVVSADLASRLVIRPLELPITAVTSLFGAPLVIYLLLRGRSVLG